ncbi:MAG: response regulator [Planctomycetaceae bacterium]
MARTPELICVGEFDERTQALIDQLRTQCEINQPDSLLDGLKAISDGESDALVTSLNHPLSAGALMEAGGILDQLPDGIALIDCAAQIVWTNTRFEAMSKHDTILGREFFDVFEATEILGPDFGPIQSALASGESTRTTLRVGEKTYFELNAEPIIRGDEEFPHLLVIVVRDVSEDVQHREKLAAIYTAGINLSDLSPKDIADMTVDDRVELLKGQILEATQHILGFDKIEIRLLDRESGKLDPLLVEGMEPLAAERELLAKPTDNGVTGFVAHTGKSYLCEDTGQDPLYITGAADARSSLTVPLILHDEVMGTFNVESPGASAFTKSDLQFLELFGREIAVALNTLELLFAEKVTNVGRSTERIMNEVSGPVDEIIADAAWVLERYIGHDPNVCERLQNILKHTRDVRQLIRNIGESIAPTGQFCELVDRQVRPALKSKRVLVIDNDDTVRSAAHELLGRFGCVVETARDGQEGCLMARSFHYDVALADIRLPDMGGYDCFCELRRIHEHMPIILMTGFGYDPSHAIVKARQQGLKSVLYKPFRLDQLLTGLEQAVTPEPPADE